LELEGPRTPVLHSWRRQWQLAIRQFLIACCLYRSVIAQGEGRYGSLANSQRGTQIGAWGGGGKCVTSGTWRRCKIDHRSLFIAGTELTVTNLVEAPGSWNRWGLQHGLKQYGRASNYLG